MNAQLVALDDLRNILADIGYPYFVQIQSDGSCKVFLNIDSNREVVNNAVNKIETMIKYKNKERYESEDVPNDVRPLSDIEIISSEELEDYAHLKEYFSKKLFVESELKEQLNSWFSQKLFNKDNIIAPIITFYSYKGGVGRSTTLAIITRLLSKDGYNVAVLDFDLEAPGQLPLLTEASTGSRFGIIDYLIHKPYLKGNLDEDELLKDYIVEIPKESKEHGSIHLMPAGGRFIEHYIENLARINFDHFLRLRSNPLDDLFIDIQKAIKPDFILVDARTGFADIAGTLLFKYSDLVSVHVYNNEQNKLGMESLIKQVSNMFDNIEEQSRLIWTHTSVPDWKLEQGTQEELQGYLLEQLKAIYGNEIGWKSIDREYWELGLTMYYQELDGANHKHIKEFVEKYINSGYTSLKNKIVNLLKSSNDENVHVNLTKEEKKNIMKEIKYGSFIAEEDSYETYEEFEKSFLLTESIEELLDPNIYLIIGAKGTGKSALFRVMRKYEKELLEKFSITDKVIVMNDILANSRYNEKKKFITLQDVLDMDRLRTGSDISEMLYWKRFWKVYLWLQICQEFSSIKNDTADKGYFSISSTIDQMKLPDWMKNINYNKGTLEFIHAYIIERGHMDDISGWLSEINKVLDEDGKYMICLYDHLDKLFELHIAVQKSAVSALLSFWDDGEFKYILPKIFLRKDIYSGLKIQNHTHWLTHSKEILWSQNELNRLIIKRTIAHSPALIKFIEKNGKYYIGRTKFEKKLGIEIPKGEQYVERLLNLIFGIRIGSGKKSGLMVNWFYNHLRDANNISYPRDAIHLLKLVREEMLREFEKYVEDDRIISGKLITNDSILGRVSEQRYLDLKEEYRYLEEFFEEFKKCKFSFIKLDKTTIIQELSIKNSNRTFSQIEDNIETLINIGALKKYKNGNIAMPDLYLRGFDARRTGPM
jgi:hypothetical protein